MAFFWVSQNKTHRHEWAGEYMWAPLRNKGGKPDPHWEIMDEVAPGDLIFSYVGARLSKLAVARSKAEPSPRPPERGFGEWKMEGRRIEVAYSDMAVPIPNDELQQVAAGALMGSGISRPLDRTGDGKQKYFFRIEPRIGRELLRISDMESQIVRDVSEAVSEGDSDGGESETTRKALRESRVGQGRFRRDVLGRWSSKCAVTGSEMTSVIRASHIKPWSDSNNVERLDPENGLPLAATIDALFDKGYITFRRSGEILLSEEFRPSEQGRLQVDDSCRLTKSPSGKMKDYLDYHLEHIFKGG